MNEDFSSADLSAPWAGHVRDQLRVCVRKAALCFGTCAPSPEQVHRARRLLKRANALALLLERTVGAPVGRAVRQLRSVRRELSETRDFDVMRESLDRFAPSVDAALVADLREEIEGRRRIAAGAALAASGSDLIRELSQISEETRTWRVAVDHSDLILALKRSYGKARRQGERAFSSKLAADLHSFRKVTILHREQREAFQSAWPKLVNAWCSEAQNLRDALGAFNDLSVFSAFVADREGAAPAERLLTLIEREQSDILARAEPIFRRLFCARPKELARQMEVFLASPKKQPKAASVQTLAPPVQAAPEASDDQHGVSALA